MTENGVPDSVEAAPEKETHRSYLLFGAIFGLAGGALVALIVIGAASAVIPAVDEVLSSPTTAPVNSEPVVVDPLVAMGEELATSNGCVACHSTNGVDGTGPSWKGLGATRDAAYLRQSIVDPNADIVAGFSPDIMPQTFGDTLTDDDINALIAYIQSL
jgi:cytochrome c oxidase subunit 2